ncbi:MAG: M48 family metallopeptidase [Clostridia bacterium]|nr:M48 family metallopeptidase [Clostridia bacterium]
MVKKITLNGRTVTYELQRKNVKNINLRIKADGSVTVSANRRVPVRVIEDFMRIKADFILKALARCEEIAQNTPAPKAYTEGEVFRILGEDRILHVTVGKKNTVTDDGERITMTVKDVGNFDQKSALMEKWKMALCQATVKALCEKVYPAFQAYGIPFPTLRFRHMTSRWGSCQVQKGVLTFNYALVEQPLPCIEYVVVHEFTHFLQPDHSPKFYQQLSLFLPDWREHKQMLETNQRD